MAVGPEYATTYAVWTAVDGIEAFPQDPPVPAPPDPHGWKLVAVTNVPYAGKSTSGSMTFQVVYTFFWKRAGRERVTAALAGK